MLTFEIKATCPYCGQDSEQAIDFNEDMDSRDQGRETEVRLCSFMNCEKRFIVDVCLTPTVEVKKIEGEE